MDIRNLNDIDATTLHEGTTEVWTLLGGIGDGSSISYVNDGYVYPGSDVPSHNHDEEEVFYFLQGRGLMEVEGSSELVNAGDVVYIPPRAMHSLRNVGKHPLRVLVVGTFPRSIPSEFHGRSVTHSTEDLQGR